MIKKTLCILANSIKESESCVAGIEIIKNQYGRWQNTGQWIRPVSHRDNGAISRTESFLRKEGRKPKAFDIVEIALLKPVYVRGHPEDWLIEPSANWQYQGWFDPKESSDIFLESPDNLWLQENQKNDRVTSEWLEKQKLQSLYLIKPEKLKIYLRLNDWGGGLRRSIRASFCYLGINYDWSMTDPDARDKYFPDFDEHKPGVNNSILLDCAAICVSLTPEWKGNFASQAYHYKLVAGIIEK